MRSCLGCMRTVVPENSPTGLCPGCHQRLQREADLAVQRQAYYDVLHEAPNFNRDLRALFGQVFREFRGLVTGKQIQKWRQAIRRSDARRWTPEMEAAVGTFATRWHLPRRHVSELKSALDLARGGKPLRLRVLRGDLVLLSPEPWDLEPFRSHPERDPHEATARYLARLRDAGARAQLEKRLVPLRHRTSKTVRILALRLYRAAVLDPKEWTWPRIAEEERREGHQCRARAVRETVHAWAKALNVELPLRAPGRPRRHK